MMRAGLVLVLSYTVGCGNEADKKLAELSSIRDAMCACTTKDCGEDVYDLRYAGWKNAFIEKPSDEKLKKLQTLDGELRACWEKTKDMPRKRADPAP
jgi:hypothetical protein